MPGTKISTTIDNSITLGTAGYTGPISITSTGAIEPVQYGATALTIPGGAAHPTLTNHGLIIGGAGDTKFGAGDGVSVTQGTVINDGTIEAGHGDPNIAGAYGALGIELSGGLVTNNGLITGGNGGARAQQGYGVRVGQGGAGILIDAAHSTLVNHGTIDGGIGGEGAGYGGAGVSVSSAASIVNTGLIVGGRGGGGPSVDVGYYPFSGPGGAGVDITSGARLTNRGTIIGGAGGHGAFNSDGNQIYGGPGGDGVDCEGANTTVLNQGKIVGGIGGSGAGGGGAGIFTESKVVNEGIVQGGIGGAAGYSHVNGGHGGDGLQIIRGGSVSNVGVLLGGDGGTGKASGVQGHGGDGAVIEYGVLINNGIVLGGSGVANVFGYGLAAKNGGGYGADVSYGGTLINKGYIAAGKSGASDYGAAGVFIKGGNLNNSGEIVGGISGTATSRYSENEGVSGGAGLFIQNTSYESVSNSGKIIGGAGANAGSSAASYGASGGYGVIVQGGGNLAVNHATFHNSGAITGGVAGLGNSTNIFGGEGGSGLRLSYGLVVNSGAISGGYSKGDLGGLGAIIGGYGTFTNSGVVTGGSGRDGNDGLLVAGGPSTASDAIIINTGTIIGGNATNNGPSVRAGSGGWGVDLAGGNLTNSGEIIGGTGGGAQRYDQFAAGWGVNVAGFSELTNAAGGSIIGGYDRGSGKGAFGVNVNVHSTVTNAGLIVGGATKYQFNPNVGYGSYAGQGGQGVSLELNSSMSNSGTIIGGAGGSGSNITGVAGGAGGFLTTYYGNYGYHSFQTRLVNSGTITGGAGGAGTKFGGAGGAGVYLKGGTLTTSGTITGGAGGYGKLGNGLTGDAVELTNGSTLVVENGAVFNGLVAGSGGTTFNADDLELSGHSAKALTGIGSQITGFEDIDFAANAAWTISGDTAGLTSGQQIAGFTSSDAITLTDAAASSGNVKVGKAGIATISVGGDIYKLDINGATVGERFTFSDYTLRESVISPAPAMTFLRPAEPASASPSFFNALGLEQLMSALAFHGSPLSGTEPAAWANHASLTAGSQLGLFQDISKPPQGDVQTLVTLHA